MSVLDHVHKQRITQAVEYAVKQAEPGKDFTFLAEKGEFTRQLVWYKASTRHVILSAEEAAFPALAIAARREFIRQFHAALLAAKSPEVAA